MEIKNCPFCGSDATIGKIKLINHKVLIQIRCKRCYSHTNSIEVTTTEEEAIAESVKCWNRRTYSNEVQL